MIKKNRFFLKVFTGYFFIILFLAVSIFLISFRNIRSSYVETLTEQLHNVAFSLVSDIHQMLIEEKFEDIDPFLKTLGKQIKMRLTVIAPDGAVLGDSEEAPVSMDNHSQRKEVAQALQGETGNSIRFSTTIQRDMLYVAVPVYDDNRVIGVIRTSLFLEDINSLLQNLQRKILFLSLVVIALATGITFLFSRSYFQPILKLINASREVARGNFKVRVDLQKKSEIGVLADSFNEMAAKIEELFAQMSNDKDELDCVISSIADGLLVIDANGKILAANESFMKIIRSDDLIGRNFADIFSNKQDERFIDAVIHARKNFVDEISWGDEGYLCSVSYVARKNEIVLVFHNITELQKLEKTKRDFVSNVSHELRTPLTAIKGFLETMEDEKNEEARNRYIEIIRRHTERLINIVKDLLLLSNLEDKHVRIECSDTNLAFLVPDILKVFEEKLRQKGIEVRLEIPEDIGTLQADYFKLEQLFINLIDNAIKYTDTGTITIAAANEDGKIRIEIRDTGIGITDDDLPRIFERFYVVDKSRSRKAGGTGLGLSIVKHIVQLHNGEIRVESRKDGGTRFIIILPRRQPSEQENQE